MRRTLKQYVVVLVGAGILSVAAFLIVSNATASSDPDGTWTLTGIVENDGTQHGTPPGQVIIWTIDVEEQEVVCETFHEGASEPFEAGTYAYEVDGEDWYFPVAGEQGQELTVSVDCESDELVLTRLSHDGPLPVTAPAPIYPMGGTPPLAPAEIQPPRKFILSR